MMRLDTQKIGVQQQVVILTDLKSRGDLEFVFIQQFRQDDLKSFFDVTAFTRGGIHQINPHRRW